MHSTVVCWLSRHSSFLCPMAKVGIFPIHLDPPTVEHRLLFRLLLGQRLNENHELEKRMLGVPLTQQHRQEKPLYSSSHHTKNGCTMHQSGTFMAIGSPRKEGSSASPDPSRLHSSPKSSPNSTIPTLHGAIRNRLRTVLSQDESEEDNHRRHHHHNNPHLHDPYSLPLHQTPQGTGNHCGGEVRVVSSHPEGKGTNDTPLCGSSTSACVGLHQNRHSSSSATSSSAVASNSSSKSSTRSSILLPCGHTTNMRLGSIGSHTLYDASEEAGAGRGGDEDSLHSLPREFSSDLGYMDDFYKNISSFSQLVPFEELILIPSTKFPLSLSQSVNLAALTVLGTRGIPHLHIDFTALEHPDDSMPIVYQLVRRYPRGAIVHWLHDAYEMRSWANFDWIKQTIPLLLLNTQSVSSYKRNANEAAAKVFRNNNHSNNSATDSAHGSSSGRTSSSGPLLSDSTKTKAEGSDVPLFPSPSSPLSVEREEINKTASEVNPSEPYSSATSKEGWTTPSEPTTPTTISSSSPDRARKEKGMSETGGTASLQTGKQQGNKSVTNQDVFQDSRRVEGNPFFMTRWWRAPPPSSSSANQSDIVEVNKWYRGSLESSWLFNHNINTSLHHHHHLSQQQQSQHSSTATSAPAPAAGGGEADDTRFSEGGGRRVGVGVGLTEDGRRVINPPGSEICTRGVWGEGESRATPSSHGVTSASARGGRMVMGDDRNATRNAKNNTHRDTLGDNTSASRSGEDEMGDAGPTTATIPCSRTAVTTGSTPSWSTHSPERAEDKIDSMSDSPRKSVGFLSLMLPCTPSAVQLSEDMLEEDIEWMRQAKQLEASLSPSSQLLASLPDVPPSTEHHSTPTTGAETPTSSTVEVDRKRGDEEMGTTFTKTGGRDEGRQGFDEFDAGVSSSSLYPSPPQPCYSSSASISGASAPFTSPTASPLSSHPQHSNDISGAQREMKEEKRRSGGGVQEGSESSHSPSAFPTGVPHGSMPSALFPSSSSSSSVSFRPPATSSPLEVGQLLRELYPTLWSIPSAFSGKRSQHGHQLPLPAQSGFQFGLHLPTHRRRPTQKVPPPSSPVPQTKNPFTEHSNTSSSSVFSPSSSIVPGKGKQERLESRGLSPRRPLQKGFSTPTTTSYRLPTSTPLEPSSTSAAMKKGGTSTQKAGARSPEDIGGEGEEGKEGEMNRMMTEGEENALKYREDSSASSPSPPSSNSSLGSFPYVEVFAVTRHSGAEVRQLLWDQMADEARFLLTKTVWKYITTHGLYHNERRWSAAVAAVSTLSTAGPTSPSSFISNLHGSGGGEEKDASPHHRDPKLASGYFSFQHLHRSKKPFRSSLRSTGLLHISGLVPRLELHYDKNNPLAKECYEGLQTFSCPPGEEPDLIVPIGGDGYMLTCIREHWRRFLPFYGINAGHVGHLLNSPAQLHELFSYPLYLHSAIMLYCQCEQPPPPGSPPGTPSVIVSELAFNDAWVERSSGQTAHLRIFINGEERIHKLKGDGVLLSTAAGSTAYSRALGASPVPIGAPLIQIVGSNVVSPPQWRPAHLEQEDEVEIVVLDRVKRPCRCFVDAVEVGNVQRMLVRSSRVAGITLAYTKSCDLQSKLYDLQFPGSRGTSTNGW